MNSYKNRSMHQAIFSLAAMVKSVPGETRVKKSALLRGLVALFFAAIFFGVASDVQAQITLVQTKTGSTAGATSVSATYSPAPLQNNLLVAIIGTRDSVTITAPSGWSTARNESGAPGQAIFYKIAGAAEATGVTVTVSASTALGLHIYEYTGNATTSPLDSAPAGMTGTDASLETATITTSNANDLLIVGVVINDNNAVISAYSNSFTERNDFAAGSGGNRSDFGGADRNSSPGTVLLPNNTTATATESGAWRSQIAAFKALVPTAVEFASFNSTRYKNGTLLEWKTGHEVDNLGFNIYREQNGRRTRVTPQIVAGSALLAGAGIALRAGNSYSWWDSSLPAGDAQYWVEDVDLKGHSVWHGPFAVASSDENDQRTPGARGRSPVLSRIGAVETQAAFSSTVPAGRVAESLKPSLAAATLQNSLASLPAVKLSIKQEGWYRVSQPQLAAAGINPATDPRRLQLFVDGREIPFIVTGEQDGQFNLTDAIEFYGLGLDTPSTDARTYWLVAGAQPGQRIKLEPSKPAQTSATSFPYTVERRERSIYFAALKNGDRENFFGSVIAAEPVDQSLTLQHVANSATEALLDVTLQGVTESSHRVRVQLNGTNLGEVKYDGQAQGTARFAVAQSLLREGSNELILTAQDGEGDVSLVDCIKLTYAHSYTADNNALRFSASARQQVSVGGFSNSAIRIFDVTNANEVKELAALVTSQKDGFAAAATVPGSTLATLLALSDDQVKSPAAITANQPSAWRQTGRGADLIIITRGDMMASANSLKAHRQSQGLAVVVVDIADVYDEFNYGHKSVQAVKDFLSFAKSSWKRAPRYALFLGDASFDPKDYLHLGISDLIPTKLIDSSLLETACDDWLADFNSDGLADLALGRLPARSAEEASLMVSKIISYDSSSASDTLLLVADRNEGFDFEAANDQLKTLIGDSVRAEEIRRSSTDDATARSRVLEAITRGQKIVNYTGHGSVEVWAGNMLTSADARGLANDRLAVFVVMNCLNGFFQDVFSESLAEALMRSERGAVAVWASSALTGPDEQVAINQQLYRLLFDRNNQAKTLGEAAAQAKATVAASDVRRTWILFGDPTMKLR